MQILKDETISEKNPCTFGENNVISCYMLLFLSGPCLLLDCKLGVK